MNKRERLEDEMLDEQARELRDAYKMLRDTATRHKVAEANLTKNAPSMCMQAIQNEKNKIAQLRKEMNSQIKKLHKLGGEWNNEEERNKINV